MKLHEIVLMKHNLTEPGIDDEFFANSKAKKLGEIDGFDVMMKSATIKPYKKVAIMNSEKEVAVLVGVFFKYQSLKFFKIDRIFVEPEYRGKSLMRKLWELLKDQWKIQFMSDRDLTQDGIMMWCRFKTDWNVVIFNSNTGERIPWTDKAEKELFVPEDDFNRVRHNQDSETWIKANGFYLISEEDLLNKHYNGIPSLNEDILTPTLK